MGPLGRLARVALGAVVLWWFRGFLTAHAAVAQRGNVVLYLWAAIGAGSHVLGTLLPPLRRRSLRLAVVGTALAAAVTADAILARDWWGPALAAVLWALALVGLGVLGVEFVLAGLLGQPGCESEVVPNLLRPRSDRRRAPCPLWDPLDRWEARRRRIAR